MQRGHPATTLFPLILAGLLAGMSYWLEMASRPLGSGNDGKQRHDPDYFVENFQIRRFDAAGLLQNTLVADKMWHYPDDDTTVVSQPRLTYHRDPPTFVRAREGRIDSSGEHVELIDDVHIKREGKLGKPPTVLTTTRLDAYPDEEVAKTQVPVVIVQGLSRTTGNTMDANNKTGIYVLDGAVRGIYYRNGGVVPPSGTIPPVAAPKPASAVRPAPAPITQPAAKPKPAAKAKPAAKPKARPKAQPKPQSKTQPKR